MSVLNSAVDYSMVTGDSRRIKECPRCEGQGNSNAVQMTRKEDGFLFYCFRCEKSYFISDTKASPQQVRELAENASKDKKINNRPEQVVLPADFTFKIPAKGLVMLYDIRIMDDDIKRFEIGWSPSHGRLIIPVYKYGQGPGGWAKKLVGVMGRKLKDADPDKPKWWTQRNRDVKHPRFIALPETNRFQKQVVFVEDIFSAIRISTTGRIASALLTTYFPYELYPHLRGWDVRIWLDSDAYNKAVKYQAALGTHGLTATAIYTDKDPKMYSNKKIEEAIINGRIKS